MSTYQTVTDERPAVHTDPDLRSTGLDKVRSDRPTGPNSNQSVATTTPTSPTAHRPARERGEGRSAADVATTLLTVLVAGMAVISILGLTVLDHQDGNSTGVIVSGAIGISAGVIGLVLSFTKAYRTS